jgi:AraC-like DNA-binding protein
MRRTPPPHDNVNPIAEQRLTPRSRVRVLTRRAGDLLLIECVDGEPVSTSGGASQEMQASEIIDCAAVVTRRDESRAPMRLRLPRRWIEDAARRREAASDAVGETSDVVSITQYAAVSGLRLGDVARTAGVVTQARVPTWLAEARGLIEQSVRAPRPMRSIAEHVGVHPVYLSRAFRRCFGMTASAYLAQCKLERACGAIMDTDAAMSFVALDSGFADQSHMSRSVAAALELSPTELRRRSVAPRPVKTTMTRMTPKLPDTTSADSGSSRHEP